MALQVLNQSGTKVVESGPDRFNVAVTGYDVFDGNNDGIFEPGEDGGGLIVRRVEVMNDGGLTLPAGAHMTFPATGSFRHPSGSQLTEAVIMRLGVNSSTLLPEEFPMSIGSVLITGRSSLAARHLPLVTRHSSLVTHHSPSSFVTQCSTM